MIDRQDFALFMHCLIDEAANAGDPDTFANLMTRLIIYSYEINDPEVGRVDVIDVTDEIRESMGQHWAAFAEFGIEKMQFLSFYIEGDLIMETGRLGNSDDSVDPMLLLTLGEPVIRAFAKGTTLAMRRHGVDMLTRLIEDTAGSGDRMGLGQLVREFLEEEVDETVAKFSQQLDAVFGVAAAIAPDWSPPGGERHDPPTG